MAANLHANAASGNSAREIGVAAPQAFVYRGVADDT